ncbi:MAG TPA: RNA polymerase sigma-70 factor [Vicinamibacterales bacterium]|nr:RNA polymerase sigma-70 factor [Vicinamibacterales bacterium]
MNERDRDAPDQQAGDRAGDGSPRDGAATAHPDEKTNAFNQYRRLLLSIAYRMLGSMAEAEDLVQDAYIRWQQTSTPVRSPRAFLVTTVSRLCINHLQSARVQREVYVGTWLPEPVIADEPSERPGASDESISIAFLLLLERLTPAERAVFLLREVFEYEYGEIASILNQSAVACRQILRRARRHMAENRPRFTPSPEQRANLLKEFLQASARGDLDGLVALLHQDVVLYADGGGKTTAILQPILGPARVARFILRAPRKLLPPDLVRRFTDVNGQPAIVAYRYGRVHSVFTIEVDAGSIRNIFIMSNPEKLSHLPDLPGAPF